MFKHYMKQGWQYNLWPRPNKMRQNCQFPALGEKQPHNIGNCHWYKELMVCAYQSEESDNV